MTRLLICSNMFPSLQAPYFGVFVKRQVRAMQSLGVECEVVASQRRGGSPWAAASKYAALTAAVIRQARPRPDAIIAHYVFPTGAAALVAARRAGRGADPPPVAVVAHGGDVAHGAPARMRATSAVLRRADLIVAVSRSVAADCAALGAPSRRTIVASMGYDAAAFAPADRAACRARLGLDPSRRYAVLVGNLIERKGIGVVLQAAQRLHARRPELTWLLAGAGDPAPWQSKAGAAAGALQFIGSVAPAEVATWLCAADVAVVPSLREPYGVAAVEALACGIPVVASRTGGLAEIVTDGQNGLLIEPGDADALAASVLAVLDNQQLATTLRAAGLVTATSHTSTAQARILLDALAGPAGL